jgi:hypothetical protein
MKTIIILGALVISTGAFAQGRIEKVEKQISTPQTEIKQQSEKIQQDIKAKVIQTKEDISNIDGSEVKDQISNKLSTAKEDVEDEQEMVDAKVSQGNAAEAKLKATQVETKADAEAMISTSKEETKETMGNVDSKMVSARTKLAEKLASGEMTKAQVDEKMAQLVDFEKRKNAIMSEMK